MKETMKAMVMDEKELDMVVGGEGQPTSCQTPAFKAWVLKKRGYKPEQIEEMLKKENMKA